MIAFGPDFKQHFLDLAPVSNVDLAKTFARILKVELPLRGRLEGRILSEALKGGPDNIAFETKSIKSEPAGNGQVAQEGNSVNHKDARGAERAQENRQHRRGISWLQSLKSDANAIASTVRFSQD